MESARFNGGGKLLGGWSLFYVVEIVCGCVVEEKKAK